MWEWWKSVMTMVLMTMDDGDGGDFGRWRFRKGMVVAVYGGYGYGLGFRRLNQTSGRNTTWELLGSPLKSPSPHKSTILHHGNGCEASSSDHKSYQSERCRRTDGKEWWCKKDMLPRLGYRSRRSLFFVFFDRCKSGQVLSRHSGDAVNSRVLLAHAGFLTNVSVQAKSRSRIDCEGEVEGKTIVVTARKKNTRGWCCRRIRCRKEGNLCRRNAEEEEKNDLNRKKRQG
ncbi:hypothetical protein M8C21_019132 [Ambrosia artemisiifolia]|uniref:Uncharacterized protein n=1 Tax=Ambrosia artemisiifolia TaxID=4212 RepID=A0AAD5GQQ6_AMBAR|nr:hypothetical protein M8C21_019132 [Ambrosia artemisiifolia]